MRYFLELSYHGKKFSGFQIQENAPTIQYEVEQALFTILRTRIELTGSSRTDAGVHALQNFFHFDSELELGQKQMYSLNAVLPASIAVKRLQKMPAEAHSRFDATARRYRYFLIDHKNPFYTDRAWHYPFPLNRELLQACAAELLTQQDYTSFSKRNTQAKTMICMLTESQWVFENGMLVYQVTGNRFLRGMVRGLVATMLLAGRGKITLADFLDIIAAKDCTKADFSAPGHGLFLEEVRYPEGYFEMDKKIISEQQ